MGWRVPRVEWIVVWLVGGDGVVAEPPLRANAISAAIATIARDYRGAKMTRSARVSGTWAR